MFFKRRDPGIDPKERALWGDLMGLGMVFPVAIALGFFLGRWAGGLLGYPRAGGALGLVWGAAAGFWELYKTTLRLNRMDEAAPHQDAGKDEDGKPRP